MNGKLIQKRNPEQILKVQRVVGKYLEQHPDQTDPYEIYNQLLTDRKIVQAHNLDELQIYVELIKRTLQAALNFA